VEHLTKREIARKLLGDLFTNRQRVPIAEAVAAGQKLDVSRRTLTRACSDLGIREIHNGPYGAFWEK
jgi:hypothetical protein